MEDLALRVLAAIGETEQFAEAATGGPWVHRNLGRHDQSAILVDTGERSGVGMPIGGALIGQTCGPRGAADARHIARQDPEATLRRCAVDRRMVERYRMEVAAQDRFTGDGLTPDEAQGARKAGHLMVWAWAAVVRDLAEGYGITEEDREHGGEAHLSDQWADSDG